MAPASKKSAKRASRGAREKILSVASELFYKNGVRGTGVDTIIARAGVAKMSLYNHFPSKDDLIVAFLNDVGEKWLSGVRLFVEQRKGDPEKKLLSTFDALMEWFHTKEFRGCPFLNTAGEVADRDHKIHKTTVNLKLAFEKYLQSLIEETDVADAAELAEQLRIVADGAIAAAWLTGDAAVAQRAKRMAKTLLATAARRGR